MLKYGDDDMEFFISLIDCKLDQNNISKIRLLQSVQPFLSKYHVVVKVQIIIMRTFKVVPLKYVTASGIISHDAELFKIVLALYIKVQALSFDMVL